MADCAWRVGRAIQTGAGDWMQFEVAVQWAQWANQTYGANWVHVAEPHPVDPTRARVAWCALIFRASL